MSQYDVWGPRSSRAHIDLVVIMMEINIEASAKTNSHLPPVPITYFQQISPPVCMRAGALSDQQSASLRLEKLWSSETTGWESDWPMTQIDWVTGAAPELDPNSY